MNRGAWWTTVLRVAQSLSPMTEGTEHTAPFYHSWTQLKGLSTQHPSVVWMGHACLIRSAIDGCFGCFYFLAVTNNGAAHICVQVFVRTCFYFSRVCTLEWNCWIVHGGPAFKLVKC